MAVTLRPPLTVRARPPLRVTGRSSDRQLTLPRGTGGHNPVPLRAGQRRTDAAVIDECSVSERNTWWQRKTATEPWLWRRITVYRNLTAVVM